MNLSDFLIDVGRPIAYYPSLARCLGSVKASIFLCQMLYWTGKEKGPDGIYKSSDEIMFETGLSYKEQRGARKILTELKILKEKYNRLEHKMYYSIDTAVLNSIFEEWIKKEKTGQKGDNGNSGKDITVIPELTKGQFGNLQKVNSSTNINNNNSNNINNTENTTENTKNNEVMMINFDFTSQEFKNITIEDKKRWKEAYPAVNIEIELKRMREWILANPAKGRKRNYRRFITNWLSRVQDAGGTKGVQQETKQFHSVNDTIKCSICNTDIEKSQVNTADGLNMCVSCYREYFAKKEEQAMKDWQNKQPDEKEKILTLYRRYGIAIPGWMQKDEQKGVQDG